MKYPKVLIIGTEDVFSCNTSISLTIRSFMEDWPSDCVHQVICGTGSPTAESYILTNKDRYFYGLFSRKKVRPTSIKRNEAHFYSNKRSVKQILKQVLVDIYCSLPYKYKNELDSFIDEFKPDVIYSCTSNPAVIRLVEKIVKKKKIPFIPHFFDDWPSDLNIKSSYFCRRDTKLVERIIHNAPAVLCICELMCREYEKRYNYNHFYSLMHSVYPMDKTNVVSDDKTLIYAGSLYLSRYKTLVELCKVVSKLNDKNVRLVLYTTSQAWEELKEYFAPYHFVVYGGFINQDELTHRINEAYGLVFVESFDEEMLHYTRLSMSTKIPEYLSSGRPILAIGNDCQGSISYLKENKAAYMVTRIEDLKTVIPQFINREGWDNLSNNANKLFYSNHHRDSQKEHFRSIIEECTKR